VSFTFVNLDFEVVVFLPIYAGKLAEQRRKFSRVQYDKSTCTIDK